MKNFVAIALAGLFAGTASAQLTVDVELIETLNGEGAVDASLDTYVFTLTSSGSAMTSLQADFTGVLNQVNPAGNATVFEDSNSFFGFVGANITQDSQFRFVGANLLIGAQSESASSLSAAFTRPGTDDFGTEVAIAHVAVPAGSLDLSWDIGAVIDGSLVSSTGTLIPEPASLGLLAAGAGLVGLRRRR